MRGVRRRLGWQPTCSEEGKSLLIVQSADSPTTLLNAHLGSNGPVYSCTNAYCAVAPVAFADHGISPVRISFVSCSNPAVLNPMAGMAQNMVQQQIGDIGNTVRVPPACLRGMRLLGCMSR